MLRRVLGRRALPEPVPLARDFLADYYVADGDLVTGQNQNAGPMVARLMLQRVLAKRKT